MRQMSKKLKYFSTNILTMKMREEMIVKALEKDGKLSTRRLAKKVGLPISTVHRKVKKMEEQGIIKGYKAVIDHEKTGHPIPMLIFINLSESNPKEFAVPHESLVYQPNFPPERSPEAGRKGRSGDFQRCLPWSS